MRLTTKRPPSVADMTPKQHEATAFLERGGFLHFMSFGGGRSTKTFRNVLQIVARAVIGPGSRHAIIRHAQKHVKASVWADTFPKVMKLCFPQLVRGKTSALKPGEHYYLNRTELVATFWNGAEIWFLGLDDAERAEKILGMEFVTIFLNEVSQLAYKSVTLAQTRLAQRVEVIAANDNQPAVYMPLLMLYDCNPPRTKKHWCYRLFFDKVDPETGKALPNPNDYGAFQMNPSDNPHLPKQTLQMYQNMSPADRQRYFEGVFGDAGGGMWDWKLFRQFPPREQMPDFRRIVVAVDPPAGRTKRAANDDDDAGKKKLAEAGIVVAALGLDGRAYVLADMSVDGKPEEWARVAVRAYHRFQADAIVGEVNQGGDMVRALIQSVDSGANYIPVRATRGKVVRAEPVAALYGEGRVFHAAGLDTLENQMCEFTLDFDVALAGYSPDRVDALVWALTELMLQESSGHGTMELTGT